MNTPRIRFIAVLAVALAAVSMGAVSAFAQAPTANKAIVFGKDSRMYVVDFNAGTAAALPANFGADKASFPSPDLNYIVTSDKNGLVVYRIAGSDLEQVKVMAGGGLSSVAWSPDSTSFVYVQNVDGPNGSVTVQIYQWNITTAQGKRLL